MVVESAVQNITSKPSTDVHLGWDLVAVKAIEYDLHHFIIIKSISEPSSPVDVGGAFWKRPYPSE